MTKSHSLVRAEAMCECLRENGMSIQMIKQLIFRIAEDSLTDEDKEALKGLARRVNEKVPQTLN